VVNSVSLRKDGVKVTTGRCASGYAASHSLESRATKFPLPDDREPGDECDTPCHTVCFKGARSPKPADCDVIFNALAADNGTSAFQGGDRACLADRLSRRLHVETECIRTVLVRKLRHQLYGEFSLPELRRRLNAATTEPNRRSSRAAEPHLMLPCVKVANIRLRGLTNSTGDWRDVGSYVSQTCASSDGYAGGKCVARFGSYAAVSYAT